MQILRIVLVDGRELNEQTFRELTGHEIACGCFRCGQRIAVQLSQLLCAHAIHHFESPVVLACTECQEDAAKRQIGGDGADAGLQFPKTEFKLGN